MTVTHGICFVDVITVEKPVPGGGGKGESRGVVQLYFGRNGESEGSLQLVADQVLEGICCDTAIAEGFIKDGEVVEV